MHFLHLHVYIQNPSKIYQDKAKGILIAPNWPSQQFYPRLIETSLHIIFIPPRKRNLYLPSQPSLIHPLHRKLSLLVCLVDGATIHYQRIWNTLSSIHGQKIQERNTEHVSVNGFVKTTILV